MSMRLGKRAIFREMMPFPFVKSAIPFEKTEFPTHLAFKSNADVEISFGLAIILNGKPYLPNRIAVLPVFLGFYDLVWTIFHMFLYDAMI